MKQCAEECFLANKACSQLHCRLWVNYKEDLNCAQIAVEKNGAMTLKEVAKRLDISYVRVAQLEKAALRKLRKKAFTKNNTNYRSN